MKVDYLKDEDESKADNKENSKKDSPRRILVNSNVKTMSNEEMNDEILVVVSKLKKYIKDKHGLNTSAEVLEKISDIIRVNADRACIKAKQDGRKTVLDRDF